MRIHIGVGIGIRASVSSGLREHAWLMDFWIEVNSQSLSIPAPAALI